MARPPGSGRVSSAPSAPTTEEFLEEGSFFFFSFLRVLHFLIDEISQRNKYDSRSRFINQLPSLLLCSLLKHLQVMMDDGSTPLSSRRADPHAEREPGAHASRKLAAGVKSCLAQAQRNHPDMGAAFRQDGRPWARRV